MTRNNSKIEAEILAEFQGLTIYGKIQPAKRTGRDRVWIQIRQNDDVKVYRVAESLSYARCADIQFEAHTPVKPDVGRSGPATKADGSSPVSS